jgi:putative Mg2+ transporter-C (MgtC) family protein
MIDPQTVALRIGLALIFGAIIGVEREWRHKNAGIKTNTLVAIGAATFAMMTNTFGPGNHNPAQLAAAVVSGIGFIGAGVIIHRRTNVQGVTTAATLWANASMGVAVGLGYTIVGSLTFLGIIIVQFGIRIVEKAIARRVPQLHEIELRIECDESSVAEVNAAWTEFASDRNILVRRHGVARSLDGFIWYVVFVAAPKQAPDLTRIEERLVRAAGVRKIDARQTAPREAI